MLPGTNGGGANVGGLGMVFGCPGTVGAPGGGTTGGTVGAEKYPANTD